MLALMVGDVLINNIFVITSYTAEMDQMSGNICVKLGNAPTICGNVRT